MLAQSEAIPHRVVILNVVHLLVTERPYYLPIAILSVRTLAAAILTWQEQYPQKNLELKN
jgi:hypothetical protein